MEAHSLQGGAPPGKEYYVYIASLRAAPGQGAQIMRNAAYYTVRCSDEEYSETQRLDFLQHRQSR